MALVPWKPFGDFDRFFEDDDWFFPVVSGHKMSEPAMDLYETEKEVTAEMSVPDIDPENIDISVEDQILKVRGTSEEKKEEKDKKKGYYRKEIRRGSFERMTHLPSPIDQENIEATYEKGVLKIVMKKVEEKKAKAKKIKVTEKR